MTALLTVAPVVACAALASITVATSAEGASRRGNNGSMVNNSSSGSLCKSNRNKLNMGIRGNSGGINSLCCINIDKNCNKSNRGSRGSKGLQGHLGMVASSAATTMYL